MHAAARLNPGIYVGSNNLSASCRAHAELIQGVRLFLLEIVNSTSRQVTMRSWESASMGCAICGDSPSRRVAAMNSMASAASLWGTWPCSFRSRSSSFVREPAHARTGAQHKARHLLRA